LGLMPALLIGKFCTLFFLWAWLHVRKLVA